MSTLESDPPSLAEALTREHHEIDAGIELFIAQSRTTETVRDWAQPLVGAMRALRRHIYLEEAIVFPRINTGALMMPVMVMLREHGELWRAMDALEARLAGPAAIEEPARSEVIAACHRMLHLLEVHNSKEEPIIYPHLDADLDDPAQVHLREFLREGRIPAGWVCERG
ncbi:MULTISPECIES: hemerythrin domain-containing protein [unclassified Pseudactinotalea]|uniref:hemerythrin domain-containing protein n=1 Tax=unclassified Pseudactinotalea TaxID=2649176 RepID=UPI00128E14D0|nr:MULTISPECIES: hemerythrin domain-containing protein [unclassified Pseudactinotalea]MPV49261.1 hemerythrin domain-containing protein [Pseudactinotalea sp. HY160]QGH69442.1 hemerythrin domain-containing protein [Pseudactinotalea sp. HY158]